MDHTAADPAIDANDLSVVIQGPATATLALVVDSVRRYLPGAELILSTWRGGDVGNLDVDVLQLNDDPGSPGSYLDPAGRPIAKPFNTNRMILSTQTGLARASRPWAMKLRNDTPLRSRSCLAWPAADDQPRTSDVRVFASRIVMTNVAVRPAESMRAYLFHPSDIVQIGRRSDLQDFWACGPVDEVENASWFLRHPRPTPDLAPYNWARFFNEQLVWLDCLRRHGIDPGYQHVGQYSRALHTLSERSLADNFVCLEPWQFGVSLPFGDLTRRFPLSQYRWHNEWRRTAEQLAV